MRRARRGGNLRNVQIARFYEEGKPKVGVLVGDKVAELPREFPTLARLWASPASLRAEVFHETAAAAAEHGRPLGNLRLLAPIDGRTEVWACGVTYEISRDARMEESRRDASVYERVYEAERPELFFKAPAWKVSGDGQPIAVREDSTLDVPEPEVALVLDHEGEIVGYTACNDVSSRSIEGENPLYLPQAKVYLGSCSLGPVITPAWHVPDPYDLSIEMTVERGGQVIWRGKTSTSRLHRRFEELAVYLFRADAHPDGAVLSTGTCLVPEAPFSLAEGDVVKVTVEHVGTLTNPVVRGKRALLETAGSELAWDR